MKKQTQKLHFRQGDVLIRSVSRIPTKTTPIARESGRIILAHGDVTGHSHAVGARSGVQFMMTEPTSGGGAAQRFLDVTAKQVALRHEEHAEIKIPRGRYEVIIQSEYSPEAVRNVAD
jgi:hypothetical protein